MNELILIKSLSIVLILAISIFSGYYPFAKNFSSDTKHEFLIGQALSSGVFLGAALLHMLSDSAQDFAQLHIDYPLPYLLAGIVFLILLLLEHLGEAWFDTTNSKNNLAIISFIILSIHSLLAGSALGLTEHTSFLIIILIAILAHKWAASFSLAVQLNISNLSFRVSVLLFALFAVMTPLGILLGTLISSSLTSHLYIEPVFNALAAGTFLYLGTLHGLPKLFLAKKCCNLMQFNFVILGFSIMAMVAIWT